MATEGICRHPDCASKAQALGILAASASISRTNAVVALVDASAVGNTLCPPGPLFAVIIPGVGSAADSVVAADKRSAPRDVTGASTGRAIDIPRARLSRGLLLATHVVGAC